MVGDTILIKDISINGNSNLDTASKLSETLTNNTINALGIDASSRTIWVNGQPYGNAYVNVNGDSVEAPMGAEIFNDFEHNTASGAYSHAEGKGTITTNEAEHAEGQYNKSNTGSTTAANTIHSVGIGTSDTNRKNALEIMQTGDAYMIGIGGYDGRNTDSATKLQDAVSNSVNIIWSDLKALRDNKKLVPGKQYRITDYTCTTTQEGTNAESNTFDIIVTADSESILNEEARAMQHEEDSYFTSNDLNAWKIWYCLDNDTTRFAWADNVNGKGVIYRMIDEFNNDIPYDFKNIQFKHPKNTTTYYYYTFASSNSANNTDYSLSITNKCYSNTIGEYTIDDKMKLNCIIFIGNDCYNNSLGNNCYNNTFGNNCFYNSLGDNCFSNSFGDRCNTNILGSGCYSNTISSGCCYNSFGNGCYSNSLSGNCYSNSLGERCYSNSFGSTCNSNSFGNGCTSNSFGNDCYYNSFGNFCGYNSLGNNCLSNSFGNGCSYIKFASNSSASNKYNYYRYNHFGDGCLYIVFTGAETASFSNQVQKYNFAQGVKGTSNDYLPIDGKRNRAYETYISPDTTGTIKESVIAEKLDKMIEISYDELYNLRDGAKLIPGQQYRIIDYTCTTSQPGTRSAGKLFDIIVTADSISTLNEEARAVERKGNGDFDEAKLNAWKIWYCLDNDTIRFAWASNGNSITVSDSAGNQITCTYADTTTIGGITYYLWKDDGTALGGDYVGTTNRNPAVGDEVHEISADKTDIPLPSFGSIVNIPLKGKGVIYRMIDEFGNDCPYDFKNIQFYRKLGTDNQTWSVISSDNTGVPCYTFSSVGNGSNPEFTDMSLAASNNVYSNVINKYVKGYKQTLNNICFFGDNCYMNTFGNNCYENTFRSNCTDNTFGNSCYSNTFGIDCYSNSFGNDCNSNSFGRHCIYNIFGEGCNSNNLGDGCASNSFGNDCYENTIKSIYDDSVDNDWYAHHNSFGNGCHNNELGKNPSGEDINCSHNSFGNHCYSNILEDNCLSNSFANDCSRNTLGDGCLSNSFGNNCYSNTLGYSCTANSFGEGCNTNKLGNSCDSNSFGNDCTNNNFGSAMLESQFGNAVQYFSVANKNIPGVPGDGDLSSNTERLVVDNGVRYVNVYTTYIPDGDIHCKDVRICKGLNGTATNTRVSFNVDNEKDSQLIVCCTAQNTVHKRNIEDILSI